MEPSAWEVRKRLERFSRVGEEGEREGDEGGALKGGAGGSQRIEVMGEEVIMPALLKRE